MYLSFENKSIGEELNNSTLVSKFLSGWSKKIIHRFFIQIWLTVLP